MEELRKARTDLVSYFAEAPNALSAESFVALLHEFLQDLEASRIYNQQRDIIAERERRAQGRSRDPSGRGRMVVGMLNDKSMFTGLKIMMYLIV